MGLAGDYPVPIALDESTAVDGDVGRWIDAGWRGYFVIKPALLGDVAGVLGRLAAAHSRVVFSSALETAIGAQAALRLAFAWTGPSSALGFGVWPLFANPAFDGPRASPFIRAEDIDRINPEDLWSAAK
jgi:O-succinylbenzoate synthase